MEDYEYDLFWYAFNYRNASTQDAGEWYSELQDCVDRLIERGKIMRADNSEWKQQQENEK